MSDKDEKNLAAAQAPDSVPPDAPTVVTELPAELLAKMPPRETTELSSESSGNAAPVRKWNVPRSSSLAPRPAVPTPALPPASPPPVSSGEKAKESNLDADWGSLVSDDETPDKDEDSIDVEAPTIAAALDSASLASYPSLKAAPASTRNMPSPLAFTHSPQDSASAMNGMGAASPRSGYRANPPGPPPGPAEAPWANPNAVARWQGFPPSPRPSLMQQPSAIGWAVGGIIVAIVLLLLLVWIASLLIRHFF